jgi:hypothetical protein
VHIGHPFVSKDVHDAWQLFGNAGQPLLFCDTWALAPDAPPLPVPALPVRIENGELTSANMSFYMFYHSNMYLKLSFLAFISLKLIKTYNKLKSINCILKEFQNIFWIIDKKQNSKRYLDIFQCRTLAIMK